VPILKEFSVIKAPEEIEKIGIRLVAPSGYFLEDHEFSDELASHLESLRTRAPLHIEATLKEYKVLKKDFPGIKYMEFLIVHFIKINQIMLGIMAFQLEMLTS